MPSKRKQSATLPATYVGDSAKIEQELNDLSLEATMRIMKLIEVSFSKGYKEGFENGVRTMTERPN